MPGALGASGATGNDLQPGDVLAGYTVVRLLGAGGMGSVYLARHPRLPRNQALKVLAPSLGVDPTLRERFTREAELSAQLDHPNIVTVQDAGASGATGDAGESARGGLMWIAMQYVDGTDAAKILAERGPLPADRAVGIITQAAAGLDYAHARGMLHRDIKPANLLLTAPPEERVLVADFGVARLIGESTRLTGTGMMIGTLAYAAPEMLDGAELTSAIDVYALGCTLYELLTGVVAYPRTDPMAMIHAHLTAPPPRVTERRPDLPAAFDDVIARALAKNPADRYPTCGALAAAARAALTSPTAAPPTVVPTPAPVQSAPPPTVMRPPHTWVGPPVTGPPFAPASVGGPPPSPPRRNLLTIALAGVAALLVVGIVVAVVFVLRDAAGTGDPVGDGTTTTMSTPPPPSTSESATVPALTGTWRGAVSGDQDGFDVVASFTDGSPVTAAVAYPQLSCRGTWTEQSRQGQTITLAESIDAGSCVDSEIQLIPRTDGTIGFRSEYFSNSQQRNFVIRATLRRT
ncbi:MAG: serine/threonine-protein kinase [Gordonia sp. (in: high G+C Gram-positive bacteria)]